MIILFDWSVVEGLRSWSIEPTLTGKTIYTPEVNKRRLSLSMRRVLPRGRESKGQRNIISLMKKQYSK